MTNAIMVVGTGELTPETIHSREDSENSLTTELQLVNKENSFLQGYSDTQYLAGKILNLLLQIKDALNLYRRHSLAFAFFFVSESDF